MKITLDKKVFASGNENSCVGLISCSGITNSKSSPELVEMLRDMEELVRVNFTAESVKTHPLISAWKAAAAHYGTAAEHHESNVEKLMNSIFEGKSLKSSTMLADLCTFISLKYLVPVGVTDTKKLVGGLSFTLARGSEIFHTKSSEAKPVKGEFILRDSMDVLARRLDSEVSAKAMVSTATKNALVHLEAMAPMAREKLEQITEELAALIKIFCGGNVERLILEKTNPKAEI